MLDIKNLHLLTTDMECQRKFILVNLLVCPCLMYFTPGQVGVEAMHKDSKYVLFLDDDVRLHPGSIGALVSEMQKNPEVQLKIIFF